MFIRFIFLVMVSIFSLNAKCVFPNPCTAENNSFNILSNSKSVAKSIQDSGVDTSSTNWAWSKLFEQTHIGAKRLAEETPDTLPVDEIILPKDGLIIGIDKEKFEKINDLKIYDKTFKRLIYSKNQILDTEVIPANLFKFAQTYIILCNVIGKSSTLNINEKFTIASQDTHKSFYNSISLLSDNHASKLEKEFVKSVLFYENGYDYNGNAQILNMKSLK